MAKAEIDRVVALLAVRQAGVFSRGQALARGGSDDATTWRVRTQQWERVAPGVYRLPGTAPTWHQRLWIARLAVDPAAADPIALISHESAAAIDELSGFPRHPVVLLVPHGAHPRVEGVTIHQTRDLWLVNSRIVDGLPVTTPARTIVDLAAIRTPRVRLAIAVDDVITKRKATHMDIAAELASVARRGKPGVRLLAAVLDARQGQAAKQSKLEHDFFALFDRFGGPRPVPQWPYPGREPVARCADAGFADALLAVETDGRAWHTRISDLKRDHHRDAEAARAGVQVLRLLYEDVVGAPRQTWELVQETRRTRLIQLGRAA